MLENVTLLSVGFIILALVCLLWFNKAVTIVKGQLFIFLVWMVLLSILALSGFFKAYEVVPPRLLLAVAPPVLLSIVFPFTKPGKRMVANANMQSLTLIHSLRLVVEAVFLYGLAQAGYVSHLVTFEGRNFDIIPGITAILIWWVFFKKKLINKKVFLFWNVLSLSILLFTISQALLSSPLPFQLFSFEQPTVAIFHFPFILLPGFVAFVMIFSHIIAFHKYKSM